MTAIFIIGGTIVAGLLIFAFGIFIGHEISKSQPPSAQEEEQNQG